MQKKHIIFWILTLLFIACKDDVKQSKNVQFISQISLPLNDIPILDSGDVMSIESEPLNVNSSTHFVTNNLLAQNVNSTRLLQMDLWVQDICNVKLSFLKNFKVYIKSPNLPEKLVTQKDTVSSKSIGMGWTINLKDDLSSYLNEGTFWLIMKFESDEKTNELGYLRLVPRLEVNGTSGR